MEFVLRCTLRIIGDGLRSEAARLLIAERGKFATLLAKASDEANELRFVGGLRFVCSLSGHGGLAGEDELRDVGGSDSGTAGGAGWRGVAGADGEGKIERDREWRRLV